MKQRSAALRVVGPVAFLLAYPGCMLLVSDGDYKVDPGAFADGGATGSSGASGTSGASGAASGTHSPEAGSGASGTTGTADASSGSAAGGTGATGTTGAAGTGAGASGTSGMTGTAGTSGAGMTGTTGTGTGETGTTGATGTAGTSMPTDAGADQSAPDAGFDAGHDAGVDAAQDAGVDSGTNVCASRLGDDDCAACQKTSCCAELTACGTDCQSLVTCVANCGESNTTSPCGCLEQYPNGVAEYDALYTCEYTSCDTPCPYVDTGDRCVNTDECYEAAYGVTCSSEAPAYGGWCTYDGCEFDSDCENLVTASGNDMFGEPVSCIQDGNVSTCFPGCQSDVDCTPFPGTTCQPATSVDDVSVTICALP